MERLLGKLREGLLGSNGQRRLYEEHQRHFRRRVRHLPRVFFPGSEKSPDAIESLGNGAYMWFREVGAFSGMPAFTYVVVRGLPARPFLYFWRASATMRYLKEEGPDELRARCLVLRNVRIHLRNGFTPCGSVGGEKLWGLPGWTEAAASDRKPEALDALDVPLAGARGKEAIRRILRSAGMPLTRSEIAAILIQHRGLLSPEEVGIDTTGELAAPDPDNPEDELRARDVALRVRNFHKSLTSRERALLKARGYGEAGRALRSFRTVAAELKDRSPESYRLMERKVFESFRRRFDDPGELNEAIEAFAWAIREDQP